MIRNIKTNKRAVSVVVGTVIMIGIAISLIGVIQLMGNNYISESTDRAERNFDAYVSQWEDETDPDGSRREQNDDETQDIFEKNEDDFIFHTDDSPGGGGGDSGSGGNENHAPVANDDCIIMNNPAITHVEYNDPLFKIHEQTGLTGINFGQTFTVDTTCNVDTVKLLIDLTGFHNPYQASDLEVYIASDVLIYRGEENMIDFIIDDEPQPINESKVALLKGSNIIDGDWNSFDIGDNVLLEPNIEYIIILKIKEFKVPVNITCDKLGTYPNGAMISYWDLGGGNIILCEYPEKDIIFKIEGYTDEQIDVLNNDNDPNNDDLKIVEITKPLHGIATTNGCNIQYRPKTNYPNHDQFEYIISDGDKTSTATVYINMFEHYNIGDNSENHAFGHRLAQTFPVITKHSIDKIRLKLVPDTMNEGIHTITVYLAEEIIDMSKTEDPIPISNMVTVNQLSIDDNGWTDFDIDDIEVDTGIYSIVIETNDGFTKIRYDSTGEYLDGCKFTEEHVEGIPIWIKNPKEDILFEIWG